MNTNLYLTAFITIVIKEVKRFSRIWVQTILPSAVSMTLYFVIFGNLIGSRIGQMDGFNYIQYIAPGIIMMSIINNAYGNVVSSFFGAKFQRHIEEMLVAPIPNIIILSGYITGGVARGMMVGFVVTLVALFFTELHIEHPVIVITVVLLTSILFSLAGLINGIFAQKFDDITIVPTFVLTPLIYLGGVFYSINLLPEFWQLVSRLNPILYMVNAFRYGMLGVSDINIQTAFSIIVIFTIALFCLCLYLLNKGVGIKS
ncbi:MAG: ABC-2 type transport system permease protein [Gammaproteobacteria bacterium]|jgi:ABC-2 type transport system permease protein